MAKVARSVGKVAGIVAGVALIASGVGAAIGAPLVIGGISAGSIAAVAGAVSALTQTVGGPKVKPPNAQGSVNNRILGANNPLPYLMGQAYSGGVQVHDVGYGGTVDDVQNPYRWLVTVHSCCGPVQALVSHQFDFAATSFSSGAASGYYSGYLWEDDQLGARPESTALTANFATPTDWGSDYKLSGFAAIGYNLKFDKEGKRFPGGQLPAIGSVWQGVKVYDPRLDSTYPGGSGSQRITDESTWAYSANPALHALAYAYGRYVNSVKIVGVDLGSAAIDLASVVAWANVCDANSWTVNGTIYEPGDKWNNLKRICQAGGAQPVLSGGVLHFDYQASRSSLATIGRDDLAGGELSAGSGRKWKERCNTIVPRYRSSSHQWTYVQSDAVSVAAYVTADGEEKSDEIQFDLVTDKDQAAQLALYEVYQRREVGPFRVPCKPHMKDYIPGDCLTLSSELDLSTADQKAVIRSRSIDPDSGVVSFELEAETDAKHAAALAASGTAPGTITLPSSSDLDAAAFQNAYPPGYISAAILNSYPIDADPADGLVQSDDTGSPCTIAVEDFTRVYPTLGTTVSVTGTGGSPLTTEDDGSTAFVADSAHTYHIYYDDSTVSDTTPTFKATQDSSLAVASPTNPWRHYVGSVTPASGAVTNGTGAAPSGWDGTTFCVADDTPVLLAAGVEVPVALLEPGMMLRTRHEDTLEWGEYPVAAIAFVEAEVFACRLQGANGAVTIRATADHRFWIEGRWVRASEIGTSDGTARVAKITVEDAHTYVSDGVLSHNIKA